tara:strand:- start:14880 stop:15401 length:522 start_codon:yes stop_codon:yes gene_type:complete
MIKKIKENVVMDNGFVRVYNDHVEFNGGIEGQYFRMSLSERLPNYGVAIICEYNGKFIIMDNYRYAHNGFLIEIVKGMGMNDKTPEETARIEVEEEIGGRLENLISLGEVKGDLSDTIVHCFHAKISSFIDTNHEETETIENIRLVSIEEIKKLIRNNEIQDTVTLSLFAKIL